jgi:hypothetical protein
VQKRQNPDRFAEFGVLIDSPPRIGRLGRADIACPRALPAPAAAIFDNFEFDALTLLQGVKGAVGDRRYMEENVTLSRVGGNESETAILHEFLDGALWHIELPLIMKPR